MYKGFFDGSSKGNPGPSQCGWAILKENGDILDHKHRKSDVDRTNNYAEYMGLIELFKYIDSKPGIQEIEIFGDSKLVIEQVAGRWKCKSPTLKPLWTEAIRWYKSLNETRKVTLTWVPREKNTIADSLAQKGVML